MKSERITGGELTQLQKNIALAFWFVFLFAILIVSEMVARILHLNRWAAGATMAVGTIISVAAIRPYGNFVRRIHGLPPASWPFGKPEGF